MTKLQSIVAEIEALPVEEQQELVSMFAHLSPAKEDIFELTDEELAELDKRLAVLDSEPTFSIDEALAKFVS